MENLHNMPSLGSEAAREIAVTIKGKVSLKSFLDAIAQGGDVKLTANVLLHETVKISKGVNIDLDGHTVTASNTTPLHFTSGESTITGGTVIGASGVTATAITVSEGATLTIEGGTYSIGKDENGEGNSCIYSTGGTINITGGTFSSDGLFKGHPWVLNVKDGSGGKIEVTGGRFKGFDPSNPQTGEESFVKSGYTCVKEDDYYVVVSESEVVDEFKNALAEGGNVTLPGNIGLTEPITISKDTNIDLGGNTISSTGTTVFTFNGGNSTIENGNITSGDKCVLVNNDSTVTIKSGNYKGTDLQGAECVLSNGGNVTIEGGTFETTGTFNDKHWVLNKINSTNGKIEVKGGRFKNFNPGQPNTDDDTSYLAEGYESKSDGEWYVVSRTDVISRKGKKLQ